MNKQQDDLRKEALEFTDLLVNQYFINRSLDKLPEFMCENVSLIGTGADEISRNLIEVEAALIKELAEYSGSFTINKKWFEAVPYVDGVCIVYGTIQAVPHDTELSEENLRITLVIEKTLQGMRLSHLHLSYPDGDQEQGHFYVSRSVRGDTQTLRRTLDLRSRQLDILNRNIPGGAHQCKNDKDFTIISMSDSFISMFGYTREEIKEVFNNSFVKMVHPSDRAAMLANSTEQLKTSKDIELEYRVICKDGTYAWILDKGRLMDNGEGIENFYCLLIEITTRKKAEEELRLSLERHQIIVDQATDIIFEWDIAKDTLSFSPNWRKRFGYEAIDSQISGRIPLSNNIHKNDMPAFIKIMKDSAAGVPYSETEFRIKSSTDRYYWCRIRATVQFDIDEHPIKAVGVIADIDSEKKQNQMLLDMAQKDALTGLYNKATINSLVERRMGGCDSTANQALLILDVDHFKMVNDAYGHLAGDSVLSDVAAVIKAHIRSTDLAGRIGGDEFLIYLTEVTNEAAVAIKAEKLLSALAVLTPEPGAAPISCSVGVAVFPHSTTDYYHIYKCADTALYARKNSGRNGVTFYNPEIDEKSFDENIESAVGADVGMGLEADVITMADEQLSQYAFRVLYTAENTETTINRLLEIIGRSYDVSRVYIFESSKDGKFCSNTFEWCSDGVDPQIDTLQNISYKDDLDNYLKNFNQSGLFYCAQVDETHPDLRSILEPQGIRSMLQSAMLDEGNFVGYVGFDECRENREWNPTQVATFKLTADIISTFIVKMRQKQSLPS